MLSLIVAGVFSLMYPWFWLPIGMSLILGSIVSVQGWMKPHRLGGLFAGAVGSGTVLTYCLSTRPLTSRIQAWFAVGLFLLELIVFLGFTFKLISRGFPHRALRTMTIWMIIPIVGGCTLGFLSGGLGGANHMHSFMTTYFHVTVEQAEVIVRWIRKTIHFVAYGTLAYGFFRVALSGKAARNAAITFSLMCTLTMATFDELRQTTAPNRSGSIWDVALDMTGAASFVIIGSRFIPVAPRRRAVA